MNNAPQLLVSTYFRSYRISACPIHIADDSFQWYIPNRGTEEQFLYGGRGDSPDDGQELEQLAGSGRLSRVARGGVLAEQKIQDHLIA